MNISYRWLKSLAPELADSPDRVAERLAMYGAPVDAIEDLGTPITDVVVARIVGVRRHPNADRLTLCDVDAGTGETLQVVCGAPNVREGGFFPFAPVGARLPGGLAIRKAKIRGEESRGMLCSARELGLGRDHEGIMELRGEFTPGESFIEAAGYDDVRFDVDVTPNRPDLLSHIGVARELAPGGNAGVRLPRIGDDAVQRAVDALDIESSGEEATAGGVRIVLEDTAGCPLYLGLVIRGVRIGPSPEWLAARLRAIGVRPINNVVDATNYVLHELGQPLHAFDLAQLEGDEVRVRSARPGERIRTLDGVERTLQEDMLVIADASRAVAVAGVMGGEESEVTESTTDIFLECALFDPKRTRRTRRALGLSTDASYRYERGVDPDGLEQAARRAAELILTVAGGELDGRAGFAVARPWTPPVVEVRAARASLVLGHPFTKDEMAALLEPIGFVPVEGDADAGDEDGGTGSGERSGAARESGSGDVLRVRVPGYRSYDVLREVDLIEEVARRFGYENFGSELRPYRPTAVPDDPMNGLEARLRSRLAGRGFLEARTMAFAPESAGDVAVLNPLSREEGHLRRTLVPALLRQLEHNFARSARHVRLFEIGTVFESSATGEPPSEATHFAAVFTGARRPPHWSDATETFDIWDVKSLLVDLARELGLDEGSVRPGGMEGGTVIRGDMAFHLVGPGDSVLGEGGQVVSGAFEAPPWATDVWALEIRLDRALAHRPAPSHRPAPAYPAVERDAALLVADTLEAAQVEATIRAAAGQSLEAVHPFDLYRGEGVPEGVRSIAYRMRFRATDRTLTDEEVDAVVERILRRLREELGVERRG